MVAPLVAAALAAAAAAGKAAEQITSVTGSVSDLISLGFTIADQMKAQEGLKYDPHVFVLQGPAPAAPGPASAASPTAGASDASAASPRAVSELALTNVYSPVPVLRIGSGDSPLAEFGLSRFVRSGGAPGPRTLVYVLHLTRAEGFDTAVGDQLEVSFTGTAIEGGYVICAKGMVNQWLSGYFHFSCEVLVPLPEPARRPKAVPLSARTIGRTGSAKPVKNVVEITF